MSVELESIDGQKGIVIDDSLTIQTIDEIHNAVRTIVNSDSDISFVEVKSLQIDYSGLQLLLSLKKELNKVTFSHQFDEETAALVKKCGINIFSNN